MQKLEDIISLKIVYEGVSSFISCKQSYRGVILLWTSEEYYSLFLANRSIGVLFFFGFLEGGYRPLFLANNPIEYHFSLDS
ncbi:16581_t:CDS:2 [Funneliformis mosseae]|uniref:16581_t:CDS:1 n=1 Tax=Funneliformis mosseae TaxID=27381 RepID=A0A9N9BXB7_FUNMO|nr:16581_t:CDS:2 [Funneliformis mosseae]